MPEQRPSLGGHRSNSSINETDSLSSTPSQQKNKGTQKHVVGKHNHHTRVPSSKGLHKHHHGGGGSHTDLKKAGASTTNLKKNGSHVSLRRNRSTADVTTKARPKSSAGHKRPNSVHFEIGAQLAAEVEDGWEEASSSASPALSRSASRLGSAQSSSKPSANNSQPHSPTESQHPKPNPNQPPPTNGRHTAADARIITERLLQRTPSYNTTKMSLATATPSQSHTPDPSSLPKTGALTPGVGSTGVKDEIVSRFVNGGSSATPGEPSPFLNHHKQQGPSPSPPKAGNDEVKRARSMGNLTRRESSNTENDESESALAPHSRKASTHAYIPPQQSRTQQKLWLQRASSNIEPQAGVLHGGTTIPGYEGRAPGIRAQLEKTGLEYLVVRRYQDPVGAALKRLAQLPGNERMRRIPNGRGAGHEDLGNGRYGLSQSLRDKKVRDSTAASAGTGTATAPTTARNSFEGSGSQGTLGRVAAENEDEVSTILRGIWEKNFEMPNSA
ncbi:hypothetical protein PVAG01_06188 [Phlyctema vagabunda]|uniref:Uncharacterized protein n=1 Tax=Phlyctema vagabunda TaxID=108571 RepID=A0ABR4PG02_9HELO